MIRMCDSDGDGQVTFDEFYKMMTTPAPPLPLGIAARWRLCMAFSRFFYRFWRGFHLFSRVSELKARGRWLPRPPPVISNKKKPYSDKLGGAKRCV